MKKILLIITLVAVLATSLFAGDVKFLFTELDQHVEILAGFLPTLVTIGGSYEGLSLKPGNLTQFQALFGGGYTQRKVYQDPVVGNQLMGDFFVYDSIQTRWTLRLNQGFGQSWIEGKDLVTAYVGYEGRYEKNVDSFKAGEQRNNGVDDITHPVERTYAIPTFNNWMGGKLSDSPIYADLRGDKQIIGTTLFTGIKLNGMSDTGTASDGITAELNFKFAHKALNTDNIGFISATFNTVFSKTLLQIKANNGSNLFSIVAIDRVNVNYTNNLPGSMVPIYAQGPVSLGRKVRGYNTYSFNTNFTAVNNFDIRLSGPDKMLDFLNGVFVRVNLFFDCGYHSGKNFNSEIKDKHFLASTGAQFTMSFMDFIDLGLMMSYTLTGTKNVVTPWKNLIMGATFFLDF